MASWVISSALLRVATVRRRGTTVFADRDDDAPWAALLPALHGVLVNLVVIVPYGSSSKRVERRLVVVAYVGAACGKVKDEAYREPSCEWAHVHTSALLTHAYPYFLAVCLTLLPEYETRFAVLHRHRLEIVVLAWRQWQGQCEEWLVEQAGGYAESVQFLVDRHLRAPPFGDERAQPLFR